jgi:hypothetical protein
MDVCSKLYSEDWLLLASRLFLKSAIGRENFNQLHAGVSQGSVARALLVATSTVHGNTARRSDFPDVPCLQLAGLER